MPYSREQLAEVSLNQREYALILERLGREPSAVELGLFGSLWSEHCGYKHSKPLLRLLPHSSPAVLVEAGKENAGAVDIGHGLAIVMKVESHNHPSAVEPYQGAATGVGGIVRDIFTMGARPIALLNSLRFGPLAEPRNRYLFNGVVGGIGGYGNCLGIPDVGGEVYFADCYSANPLVNAMCVGLVEHGRLVPAIATGVGNPLMLVGAETGRDGIHGASGLASTTDPTAKELRSAVQVGNPFLEKLLLEACLELAPTGWTVGIQDLGAAGLTSSAIECAAKGGVGIEIDVARVPRRETGMTPYEVMLSESQERMLLVVKRGHEEDVRRLFLKWDLQCAVIGQVTGDGLARIRDGAQTVAQAPVSLLTEPPLYEERAPAPDWLARVQALDLGRIPDLAPAEAGPALVKLLASPNICSRESVYRQYDHQVGDNTVVAPGSADAAVLRIKGTPSGIALCTDGNGRLCYLDPFTGGALAVAEAARNVVCTGARPLALTDGLNFGNPERPDTMYQLEQCIRGMAAACNALGTPVISGNVSLYNESGGVAVYPTPVVGMLGLLEDIERRCSSAFRREGDVVALLGPWAPDDPQQGLGGSEYLAHLHGMVAGRPQLDLGLEVRVQAACLEAIHAGLLASAHDCSDGGLAVALAESAIQGRLGLRGSGWLMAGRLDALLFGEAPSRIVVSLAPAQLPALQEIAERHRLPLTVLGQVGGDQIAIEGVLGVPVLDAARAWMEPLGRLASGR